MNAKEIREFTAYLRQCTDAQMQNVYRKECNAGRDEYAELARLEAENRGIFLEDCDD